VDNIKRKIVLHGSSTLTVSLPSSWAKKHGVRKGDELNVEEHGRELRIGTEKSVGLGRKKVEIDNFKRLGKHNIASSYRQGFDEIQVVCRDAKQIKEIRDLMSREITGFEVVRQDSEGLVLKDLTGHNKNEFDIAVRRMWLLVIDLSRESLEAIKEGDSQRLSNVKILDQSVNKFCNYCLRILMKNGHSDFKKTPLYYHFVKSLEEIGDRYKDICGLYLTNPERVDRKFVRDFGEINSHLSEFYGLFYKYDPDQMEVLFDKVKSSYDKVASSGNKRKIYLSSVCKDIHDLMRVLAEINI